MTVREYKKMIAEIDACDDDCIVLMPKQTDLPGFAFEGVCPSISGMIELGPCPEWADNDAENAGKPIRALLIAPHSFHGEDEHADTQKALN